MGYRFGGLFSGPGNDDSTVTSYNPSLNIFSTLTPLPRLGGFINTAVSYGPNIYIFGSEGGGAPEEVLVYTPATDSWGSRKTLNQDRVGARTVLRGATVFHMGGKTQFDLLDSIHLYDILRNEWCAGGSLPEPNSHFTAQVVNGKIYIIGGHRQDGGYHQPIWEGTIL
jgi:N-acetylneuraminic acid mutarotase